jgi:hypothetical protein
MESLQLKILNAYGSEDILRYLPHGVTTLVMKAEGDITSGDIYPHRTAKHEKFFVGYSDESDDFLVIWGGGRREGLNINRDKTVERLFLQILHTGRSIQDENLSLYYTENPSAPIKKINLVPIERNSDLIRTELTTLEDYNSISFVGNKMPIYYSRWLPPPLSQDSNMTEYKDIQCPSIAIKFRYKVEQSIESIDSDLLIFLEGNKIAEISGDWKNSRPHAELFTVFGDKEYLILRLWLYWIYESMSKNTLRGGKILREYLDNPPEEVQTRRRWYESFDIEVPDIERFDFLIDTTNKRIKWIGTDFHYQELWYRCDNGIVKAKIANDVHTIQQIINKFKYRFISLEGYYDPITKIKEELRGLEKNLTIEEAPPIKKYTVSNIDEHGNAIYRRLGFTRKHIPYVDKGKIIVEMVSGDNRKYFLKVAQG